MTAPVHDLVSAYIAIWNERDATARDALMKGVLAEDSVYSDPDHEGLRGHAELSAAVSRAQEGFGDLVFRLGTVIGAHHDKALFTWLLGVPGAEAAVATGYDYVEFADGRISRVIGFFA